MKFIKNASLNFDMPCGHSWIPAFDITNIWLGSAIQPQEVNRCPNDKRTVHIYIPAYTIIYLVDEPRNCVEQAAIKNRSIRLISHKLLPILFISKFPMAKDQRRSPYKTFPRY